MTGAELGTLLAGGGTLLGAVFGGAKILASRPTPALPDYGALTDAYDKMVDNLTQQLERCHARIVELEGQLRERGG